MSILACFRHLVSKMECESEIKRTIFVMELKCGLINLGKVEKKERFGPGLWIIIQQQKNGLPA